MSPERVMRHFYLTLTQQSDLCAAATAAAAAFDDNVGIRLVTRSAVLSKKVSARILADLACQSDSKRGGGRLHKRSGWEGTAKLGTSSRLRSIRVKVNREHARRSRPARIPLSLVEKRDSCQSMRTMSSYGLEGEVSLQLSPGAFETCLAR